MHLEDMEKKSIGKPSDLLHDFYYIEVYFQVTHTRTLFKVQNTISIAKEEKVVVESVRGLEIGKVVHIKKKAPCCAQNEANKFIRIATKIDLEKEKQLKEEAIKAKFIFQNKLLKYNLNIKLVSNEYTLDKKKLIFYFVSEERVDFREFVKDLASVFRLRIELRQIGVRDHAKLVGDCGMCGKSLCCKSFIGKFDSVSIKMIREQNISVIPSKISGVCGRLKCCCSFEYSQYFEKLDLFPEIGQKVKTSEGLGNVTSINIMNDIVYVNILNKGIISFDLQNIKFNQEEKKRLKNEAEKLMTNYVEIEE